MCVCVCERERDRNLRWARRLCHPVDPYWSFCAKGKSERERERERERESMDRGEREREGVCVLHHDSEE